MPSKQGDVGDGQAAQHNQVNFGVYATVKRSGDAARDAIKLLD